MIEVKIQIPLVNRGRHHDPTHVSLKGVSQTKLKSKSIKRTRRCIHIEVDFGVRGSSILNSSIMLAPAATHDCISKDRPQSEAKLQRIKSAIISSVNQAILTEVMYSTWFPRKFTPKFLPHAPARYRGRGYLKRCI